MPEFTIPRFNRRYVLLPMLAAVALIATAFFMTESLRSEILRGALEVRQMRERLWILIDVVDTAQEAESSQRGYLLTRDQVFLEPYNIAKQRLVELMPELRDAYRNNAEESPYVERISGLLDSKMAELNETLELMESSGDVASSVQLIKAGAGRRWMAQLREAAGGIRDRDRVRINAGIRTWERQHSISRYIAAAGAVLNILLLLVAGAYITRDIERRNAAANELDKLVAQRTVELSELSTHLQRVTEHEKSRLARELHDELGGLLVAIKMDLAQLAKKLDIRHPDIQPRWQRIQEAITAGVDLKRRVIEELRPTLLDNMGLVAALRWQAEQTCKQAGIALQTFFPDEEPALDTNTSIAIFRVAQETLTNMVKHARASAARLTLQVADHALVLIIEDNGVGMAGETGSQVGSHGLLSMKHRIHAIGGNFHVGSAAPHGTKIVVQVPLDVANAIAMLT